MSDRIEFAVRELVQALRAEVAAAARPPDGPPALLSIQEAARRLSVGRTRLYDEIGAGRLRSVRIGRRRLVPADALAALAAGDGTERAPAPTKASAQEFDRASPRPATSRQS
jgi:excisionase family DNA binding protein